MLIHSRRVSSYDTFPDALVPRWRRVSERDRYGSRPPRLLDLVRQAIQARHYSPITEKVSASTQNQALSALLFLYRHVLNQPIDEIGEIIHARKPKRLPMVMSREEVKSVINQLEDDYDIRTVQELLGHKDVKTTMIDAHVLNRGGKGVRSPADGL